ncbi:MarR family winged helix-turn-helix transcriptional regulator [Cohnella boryungensis]|uniref:MarR family winged helix-turn-helix transcriptional regulator n=1 Tax=Cohnella boryungensis TaxID=768479 RepID=A0ABV8SJP4_9BACL
MIDIQKYVTEQPLGTETFFALVETTALLISFSEKYWASLGLNGARVRLLTEMAKAGGTILPSELAARIGVTKANISVLLVPLEKKGYISISSHEEDGRKRTIVLTPKGESLLWDVLPGNRSVVGNRMEGLSQEEQQQLIALLSKLRAGAV